jgi:hypothetical protein
MNVLEIGSSARGDGDRWSDRDILVIATGEELSRLDLAYAKRGASVVSLTPRKFRYLASRGSLFLKHAIDEGVLLEGVRDEWRVLSNKWHSTGDYAHEIESNLHFLPVLECVPASQSGASAAIDVMVCSVRNILIRQLAKRGIFKFSWHDIAQHSHQVVNLPAGAWRAVSWAREQKNKRRAGLSTAIRGGDVEEFADLFRGVLGSIPLAWTSSNSRLERLAMRFADGSYAQLRAFELLCANGAGDDGLRALRMMTARPSYFCSGRSKLN